MSTPKMFLRSTLVYVFRTSCLSQILLGPFLNTLTNSLFILCIINNNYGGESFDNTFFELQSSLKTNFRQWKPVKLKGFWHLLIKRRETHVKNKKNGTRNKFCQTGMMLSKTAWIRSLCVCVGWGGGGGGASSNFAFKTRIRRRRRAFRPYC